MRWGAWESGDTGVSPPPPRPTGMRKFIKTVKLIWAIWKAWQKVEHMDKPVMASKTIWAGILGGLAIIVPALLCVANAECTWSQSLPGIIKGAAVILGAFGVRFAIAKGAK